MAAGLLPRLNGLQNLQSKQDQARNSRNLITPKQDYSIYEFLPHESHQNDMGQNGVQRMRGDLLLRKGSQDMTSDNKVPELGINRFGGSRSMAPPPRLEQQQSMSAQALLNTNAAFPMSFIDPNQAA